MPNPKIIALTGRMGVGKSEALKTLQEYIKANGGNTTVHLVKFAQPLYDMQEYIYNRIKSIHVRMPDFVKDRMLLQWLGTDWGRKTVGDSIWVDLWKAEVKHINMFNPGNVVIVCDDCRFDNEAEAIKSMDGTIVKITSQKTADRINLQNTGHASEAGIDNKFVDCLIENDFSLEEYKNQLTYLFRKLGL